MNVYYHSVHHLGRFLMTYYCQHVFSCLAWNFKICIVVTRMSAQVIFPFSHTGFAENLADPINQYGKETTSYILRGIPFCLWVAFTSFRKTWHKGQLLEDRGTEMTARGIQVKQKDSSVRRVIFRDLTWLPGTVCVNINMARPSTFLDSRSWWGHDCGKHTNKQTLPDSYSWS